MRLGTVERSETVKVWSEDTYTESVYHLTSQGQCPDVTL